MYNQLLSIPMTGDAGIPWYVYLMLVLSAAVIVGAIVMTRKKK